ncbi:MAG: NADP-dependent isocitrate dehydrogenase, partial [Ectothiorhodospiraceae bacterium]|nr:NADP-dependent isocitrate dehydrogenase [Ectothiorhodospiraceae bacterium]
MYEKIAPPTTGEKVTFKDGEPVVPDNPIIPFIRGDGTGVDIWPATEKVIDAAVAKAYGDKRKIRWFKIYAGDEACEKYGQFQYLNEDTMQAIGEYGIDIKSPLTHPIGGGIRSLTVALRPINHRYACGRP